MTFKLIKEEEFPNKKIKVSIFEHEKTKARHIHTAYNTEENSFTVSFRTLPQNNKGIPHILEHSVLCGSEKFPSKNLFFNMKGRNFDTFMNASTGFETTQYPFSSIDKKGFFNLMEVYTDVVFFPTLDKNTFFQEGWRYELIEKDGEKKLQYSGVVFNEMIGAYADPNRVSYVEMLKKVYKGSQYENFSGGHPLDITDLNYEDFVEFHKKYYHPSNATFCTFGSIPYEDIHQKLEDWVLSKFDYCEIDQNINMSHHMGKEFEGEHPGEKGVILNIGWKMDKFQSFKDYYEVELLCRLLSSGKNSITDKLIQLGSCDGFNILPINQPAILLSINTEKENIPNIKKMLNEFIEEILKKGIHSEEFDNIFDMIEMSQRKEKEEGFGRSINGSYVMLQKYDIKDVENVHNINLFKEVRKNLSQPDYLENKIKELLINNKNTFEYVSVANPLFSQNLSQEIEKKVYQESLRMNENHLKKIEEINKQLIKRRNEPDNIKLLPKITLDNIELPKEKKAKITTDIVDGVKVHSFKEEINDLIRFEIYYPINVSSEEDFYMQYFTLSLMLDLEFKNMSLEDSNFFRQSKTTNIKGMLESFEDKLYWKFGLMSLSENAGCIVDKMKKVLTEIDFTNEKQIKTNMSSYIRDFLNGYQENAHYYALFSSRSRINKISYYDQLLNLNYYTDFLSKFENNAEEFDKVCKQLPEKYKDVFSKQPEVFIIGQENDYKTIIKDIHKLKSEEIGLKILNYDKDDVNIFFDLNIPTNHVSVSYKVPEIKEPEGPVFKVFESMIKDYLIKNIRQKNGAYGANADYSYNGVLTFYSYRDSQIKKTIELMTELPQKIDDIELTEEMLEISKLNIIKLLKTPISNITQGIMEFNRMMKGSYIPHDELTNKILEVNLDDIKKVVKKLSHPKIAVSSSIEKYISEENWKLISPLEKLKTIKVKKHVIK